nr:MAG TPA: hypothetical protein [Herelleviridae sp.]
MGSFPNSMMLCLKIYKSKNTIFVVGLNKISNNYLYF